MIISTIISEIIRYKKLAEGAVEQLPDEGINKIFGDDNNSIAVLVSHISGNLKSRCTYFLTTDGEKPWRKKDTEFFKRDHTRNDLIEK